MTMAEEGEIISATRNIEGFVVNLENYWPHGLKQVGDEENAELLHFYTRSHVKSLACRYCGPTKEALAAGGYVELRARMRYTSRKLVKEVDFADHVRAYEEFCSHLDPQDRELVMTAQILRPTCCDMDTMAFVVIQARDLEFTSLFRYFYQDGKVHVYLRLDAEAIPLIPGELNTARFSETMKLYYLGGFSRLTRNVDVVMDAMDFDRAEIPAGFGLELRDDQARTVKWMQSIESSENCDTNVIRHILSNWKSSTPNASDLRIKLGHSPYFLRLDYREDDSDGVLSESSAAVVSSTLPEPEIIRLRGGIVADNTGSGKTITTLGLIHSSPFDAASEAARSSQYQVTRTDFLLCSKGNLIVCPENIQRQWIDEAKRCNANFKIVSFARDSDRTALSWSQILEADLVVASYEFLHKTYEFVPRAKVIEDLTEVGKQVQLQKIRFHRLILDEYHELAQKRDTTNVVIKKLNADHVWGLTGTPNFTNLPALLSHFKLPVALENAIYDNVHAHNEFFRKFTKRNVPDLNLPPLQHETVWVTMNSTERFVNSVNSERASQRARLMMCSHYQLAEKSNQETFKTIKQIEQLMVKGRADAVASYENKILFIEKSLLAIQKEIENEFKAKIKKDVVIESRSSNEKDVIVESRSSNEKDIVTESSNDMDIVESQAHMDIVESQAHMDTDYDIVRIEIENEKAFNNCKRAKKESDYEASRNLIRITQMADLQKDLCETKNHLNVAQRRLTYFESVFKAINNPEENECLICFSPIPSDQLSVLPCSHLFCYECILAAVDVGRIGCTCPLCRDAFGSKSKIYRISYAAAPEDQTTLPDKYAHLDTSKYSSKLIALYRYISDLFDESPDSKVILFLQYRELAKFISETLNELKLMHVRVTGDIDQRQAAISQFQESLQVRLIMLSSEDSVSGINLTQATHIIMLHPFWTDKGEDIDLAYEKQGISRAYRFGLQHPLKVVRFAVKGTIEEEITLRRQNIRL
jgi:SNF2 family DNA or RNA helicase